MPTLAEARNATESAIVGRLLKRDAKAMPSSLAKYLLDLEFDEQDRARMNELTTKNQAGLLSKEDYQELMNYVRAGHLLAALQSQARQQLKKKSNKVHG